MSFFRLILGLGVLWIGASISSIADAQSGIEKHLGPIANFVELGQNGPWNSSSSEDWYTLTNEDSLGEIQYFWASQPNYEARDFSLAVNVFTRPSNGDLSHAGLLFHFRDAERYMAITIASDGKGYILIRTPERINLTPADGVTAMLDGSDVLEMQVVGNRVTTLLNGKLMFNIDIDGEGPTRNLGVLAAGAGVAAFTGLTIR